MASVFFFKINEAKLRGKEGNLVLRGVYVPYIYIYISIYIHIVYVLYVLYLRCTCCVYVQYVQYVLCVLYALYALTVCVSFLVLLDQHIDVHSK
jgi:hypothetical protein